LFLAGFSLVSDAALRISDPPKVIDWPPFLADSLFTFCMSAKFLFFVRRGRFPVLAVLLILCGLFCGGMSQVVCVTLTAGSLVSPA